eukprot:15356978-Ditylum_brightwellii.AAC.1
MIISAYRLCDTTLAQAGPSTCWKQQWRFFKKKGYHDPDPRKLFLRYFTAFIDKQIVNNKELIIGIDANETDA